MAGNGFIYGYTGPPFNFLGHFCTSQWNAFTTWVNQHTGNLPAVQQFYQIRAAQLRKTAGVLNQFYQNVNDDKLSPTFNKAAWRPAPQGHFGYVFRNDHLPMIAVSQIKDYMRPQFQRQDESVFTMNQIRNLIEKTEDKAQYAMQATTQSQNWESISDLITKVNGYFGQPEYEFVLVRDIAGNGYAADVYPTGTTQPRGRVHQLDAPTQYEREVTSHAQPGQNTDLKVPNS